MVKLKPINYIKAFTPVVRKVVRELGARVKQNIDLENNYYPPLKPTKINATQGRALKKANVSKGVDIKLRSTRMYNRGYFSRNAFEFKVDKDKAVIYISDKKHYKQTYKDTARWNMGENENIKRSMGKMLWLFPQNEAHLNNLISWEKGRKEIVKDIEKQIVGNLEQKIQKIIIV